MTFTPLILAGGKSTRMGSPKHLLQLPDGRPLYQHQIDLLTRTFPNAPAIYISLAQDSILDTYLQALPSTTSNIKPPQEQEQEQAAGISINIIPDLTPNPNPTQSQSQSAGPATGLVAAHLAHPKATFLVIACDHPFLTPAALRHLCRAYEPPVTCFRNCEGFCEPLVGVWGPGALGVLAARVSQGGGGVGPSRVVRELGGKVIDIGEVSGRDGEGGRGDVEGAGTGADDGWWLRGMNTPEEWQAALRVLGRTGI